MKLLGHKTSFGLGRRSSSEAKSSSENSDRIGGPIGAPAQHIATSHSSPVHSRRSSLKEAWASIKKVVKKRTSLPEVFSRWSTSSSPPTPPEPQVPRTTPSRPTPQRLTRTRIPSYREIARRRKDEKDRTFGNCLVGLIKRCPKYYYLADRETRERLVREGKADPSIFPEGIVKVNKNIDDTTVKSNDERRGQDSSETGRETNSETSSESSGNEADNEEDSTT